MIRKIDNTDKLAESIGATDIHVVNDSCVALTRPASGFQKLLAWGFIIDEVSINWVFVMKTS